MSLLFIAPKINRRSEIKNFSGVWSWYLEKEFERRGIALRFDAPLHTSLLSEEEMIDHYRSIDLTGIDHVVATGTRYFERVPEECGKVLMQRCSGAVVQIHDGARGRAPCHCTFTLRSDRLDVRSHHIGWAADHKLIRPTQIDGELRILVDHPDYGVDRRDDTQRIVNECVEFAHSNRWTHRYSSIRLRRLVDGAIEDFSGIGEVGRYNRQGVSFEEVCAEYSRTTVFLVTHPESVGLSVLETAMAGALPVAPSGFIRDDRLATIRHLTYEEKVPWNEVLDAIDIQASRSAAIENSWMRVAARMLVYFKRFEERYRR